MATFLSWPIVSCSYWRKNPAVTHIIIGYEPDVSERKPLPGWLYWIIRGPVQVIVREVTGMACQGTDVGGVGAPAHAS